MKKIKGILIMTTEEAAKFVGRVLEDKVLINRARQAGEVDTEAVLEFITDIYNRGRYQSAVFWADELYRLAGYDIVRRVKVVE